LRGRHCVELLKVGDTAVVTSSGGRIEIALQSTSSWSFDEACNGMGSPVIFADAADSLTAGSIGGSGGGGGGPNGVQTATGGTNNGGGTSGGRDFTPNGTNNFPIGGTVGGAAFSKFSPH